MFKSVFPYYLSIGMTYAEFWKGSPWLAKAYREAWNIRQHEEEAARWRAGLYFYNALRCAPLLVGFPKDTNANPGQYPDKPFPLTQEEADEQQQQRDKVDFKQYLAQMEAASERELRRREESKRKEVRENAED